MRRELVGWLVEGRRTVPRRGVSVGRRERRGGVVSQPRRLFRERDGTLSLSLSLFLFLIPPSLLHPVSVPSTPPPTVFRLYKAGAMSLRAPTRDIESRPARMSPVTFIFPRKNVLDRELPKH